MSEVQIFWFWFFVLNFLLFLPGFLFDWKASSLIPIREFLKQKSLKQKINFFFVRENQDPFKFNGDIISLAAVLLLFGSIIPDTLQHLLMGSLVALSFLYLGYYYAMVNIYQTVPVLYNDLQFAKVGWNIATQRFPALFILGIVALGLVMGLLFWAGVKLSQSLDAVKYPSFTYFFLFIVGVYNIYRGYRQKYVIIHKKLLVAPCIHLLKNLKVSWESRAKMKAWEPEFFNRLNLYQNAELKQRPNIIIASLESYGALIHELPELKDYFQAKLSEEYKLMEEKGWKAMSSLSKAPRISGGSWLSHASFLYGIFINEFALYESLMNNPVFENYQSLLHVLREKGYTNYYLNPLGGYDMSRINWDQIQRMFASDHIINDEVIGYTGQRTGSMGDSAPDQYAFRYAFEEIGKEAQEPYSLFFISNNSHYSWLSPERIEEDWKSLDNPEKSYKQTDVSSTNLLAKYKTAINYQLDIFFQFLKEENPDDTILVLFGDHQPPAITTKTSSFHAPIHIIAKDPKLLEGFTDYGFKEGLIHDDPFEGIAHQSFFSLFMRELLNQYGHDAQHIPDFLPEGHQILG
ncbi:MAG: sulfatase-like hydrolase/transferase [Bacteroidota bacterium]